jgi:TetR/AcrR family transcriptional regulator, cholesterol catabolism regulator
MMLHVLQEREKDSRRDRKARETRRRILEAALELFSQRGVDAVTVEEIAERADYARGTVFNHFTTKESLCQGLGELQLEMLEEAVRSGRITGPSASEKIVQALCLLAELPGRDPGQCRAILVRVLANQQPGEIPEHRRQVFALLEQWAEEGQRSGELRADLPPCELACFVMGLQLQATLLWAFGFVDGSLADHITRVLRLALEGIQARRVEADQ